MVNNELTDHEDKLVDLVNSIEKLIDATPSAVGGSVADDALCDVYVMIGNFKMENKELWEA